MQPTLPSARWWWEAQQWQHWGGRDGGGPDSPGPVRLDRIQRLRDLQALIERQKLQIPDILIFSPSKFTSGHQQQLHQIHSAARPTLSWNQRPVPWEMTNYEKAMKHLVTKNEAGRNRMGVKVDDLWDAAKGWAVGALLLLAALVILRATDRCLTRGFFRGRRRQSEEWTTPNVQATRQQDDVVSELHVADCNLTGCSSNSVSVDPPPPYSVCSNKNEEPPPPYSACYIAYPKDGQSLRLYDGQQQIIEGNPPISQGNDSRQVAHSRNVFNQEQTSSAEHVTVNIEDPSVSTARIAPIASRELSLDSDDTCVDASNSTSC